MDRADAHLSGDGVERQVANFDDEGLQGFSSTLERPHASQKLREVEGFDQVVVRALVQPGHPIPRRIA